MSGAVAPSWRLSLHAIAATVIQSPQAEFDSPGEEG
jgi:hypothetical protein